MEKFSYQLYSIHKMVVITQNWIFPSFYKNIKGTVSVISSDPPCTDGNAGFPKKPLQPYSDKMWKIPSFFYPKVFISVSISIVSYKQEMRKSFCRETANENTITLAVFLSCILPASILHVLFVNISRTAVHREKLSHNWRLNCIFKSGILLRKLV